MQLFVRCMVPNHFIISYIPSGEKVRRYINTKDE